MLLKIFVWFTMWGHGVSSYHLFQYMLAEKSCIIQNFNSLLSWRVKSNKNSKIEKTLVTSSAYKVLYIMCILSRWYWVGRSCKFWCGYSMMNDQKTETQTGQVMAKYQISGRKQSLGFAHLCKVVANRSVNIPIDKDFGYCFVKNFENFDKL